MNKLLHNLFPFDHDETTGDRVFFRVIEMFIVVHVLYFAWEWALYIPQIDAVVRPLGIAQYVDISFMHEGSAAFWVAAFITLFCAGGFLRLIPGAAYSLAIVLLHVQYVARYCLGEISHGSNMIGVSMVALAAGMALFANPSHRRRYALGLIYFFVGLGYTTAACSKLIGTGITWADGRHLWMWISERYIDNLSTFGYFELNALQSLILDYAHLGTIVLAIGLVVELLGFLMWFRKTRYVTALALVGMHIGVGFSMSIHFTAFTLQLALLGMPWARYFDKVMHSKTLAFRSRSLKTASARS